MCVMPSRTACVTRMPCMASRHHPCHQYATHVHEHMSRTHCRSPARSMHASWHASRLTPAFMNASCVYDACMLMHACMHASHHGPWHMPRHWQHCMHASYVHRMHHVCIMCSCTHDLHHLRVTFTSPCTARWHHHAPMTLPVRACTTADAVYLYLES
jgi:hypothetical protein